MKIRMSLNRQLLLWLSLPLLLGGWRSDFYFERPTKASRSVAMAPADQSFPPHTDTFKFSALHGSEFIKNKQLCFTCHGSDYKGGLLKSSCLKCHPVLGVFDHFNGDIKESHGGAYLKDPAACTMCHGADLEGKGSAIGCRTCHNFPHSERWAMPAEHGAAFIKSLHHEDESTTSDGKPMGPVCLDCHGKDSEFSKKYPDRFVGCDRCHIEMPHPGGVDLWARAGKHADLAQTYEGKCGTCHDKYSENLPNFFKSCRTCHGSGSGNAKRWEPIMKWQKPESQSWNTPGKSSATANRSVASEQKAVKPIMIFRGAKQ